MPKDCTLLVKIILGIFYNVGFAVLERLSGSIPYSALANNGPDLSSLISVVVS